jgi:hypothetical protein
MNTKDLGIICTVALGTAALTVATFLGETLEAGGDENQPRPAIAKPELVANGIKLTLGATGGREFKAGDAPSFDLVAVNTLGTLSETQVRLMMTATAPSSPAARMVPMPVMLWQEERALTLGPNETKSYTCVVQTNLPPNSIISVWLMNVKPAPTKSNLPAAASSVVPMIPLHGSFPQGVVALSFSTVPQSTALASAPPLQPVPHR